MKKWNPLGSTQGKSPKESKGRLAKHDQTNPVSCRCQGSRPHDPYGYRPALTGAYPEVEIAVDGRAESGGKVLRSLCLNRSWVRSDLTFQQNHTLTSMCHYVQLSDHVLYLGPSCTLGSPSSLSATVFLVSFKPLEKPFQYLGFLVPA